MSDFAASETNCNFNLIAGFQKAIGIIGLNFDIVVIYAQTDNSYLFDVHYLLVFLCLFFVLHLFKTEFSVIKNFAYRRICIRLHTNKVKTLIFGSLKGFRDRQNT